MRVAERGDKRRLRELAERNARLALDQDRLRREHRRQRRVESLADLRDALGMDELPVRIEGFDISNLGGEHTVASMVVFEGGATKKADYRRFRVRGERADGPDDFASMEEVLGRRMNRYLEQVDLSPHDGKRDESFAALPALVVIDGGKGQLGAAAARPAAVHRARRDRDRPRQAARGGLRPRQRRRRSTCPPTRRPRSSCSGSATRLTASRSTTTAAAATGR